MIRKLISKLLHKEKEIFLYADASYNKGFASIGYIKSDLSECKYKNVKANNVNDAELKAIEFAHEAYPNLRIGSDSEYAINNTEGDYVFYVERKHNLANFVARSAAEMAKSKTIHDFS